MRMVAGFALAAIVLLASLAPAQAEEGWRTYPIGPTGLEIHLPEGWTVLVDELDGRLTAKSHDAPVVRLTASAAAAAAASEASLQDLRDDVVGALFGRPGTEATIEDEAERPVGERPALWTLLAYEGASGPRRSLLVVLSDVTVRFDLAADVFPARRALIVEIAGSLRTTEATEATEADDGEAAPMDVEAMDLLREFMTRVPRTRAELDELAEALGREGDVDDALGALDELVTAAGTGGEEVLALVGWRRFHHPLPEALHYRGHDFLRAVEEANAQRWFGPDEGPALDAARRAWAETQRHIVRLAGDHRYRASDQMLANLAHDPALKGRSLIARSAPPFLVIYPSATPLPAAKQKAVEARLADEARVLAAVHRRLNARYRAPLGLTTDLTAPYGGRPDLPVAYRSFPDGVVLAAIVPPDGALGEALLQGRVRGPLGLPGLSPGRPDLLVLATTPNLEATAVMGAKQLLLAFTRQCNRWAATPPGFAAVIDGFARRFAVLEEENRGRGGYPRRRGPNVASMRALARALADAGRPYPVIPLRQLVAFGSVAEAVQTLQRVKPFERLPRELLASTLFDQSWALATFLLEAEDGRWRDAYLRTVRAGLDRELGRGGLNEAAFARAFRLNASATSSKGWKELEGAWEHFVREELLQGIGGDSATPKEEASPEEPDEDERDRGE